MEMLVRDSFACMSGDTRTVTMPSGGIEIIAEDGRTLFTVSLSGATLEVSAGSFCKHDGKVLDNQIAVKPRASNLVWINRNEVNKEE